MSNLSSYLFFTKKIRNFFVKNSFQIGWLDFYNDFFKKIFSLKILKIRKNWLWVQIFEIFRFFSISSQVLTMLCYSTFLETYFFGKFGLFYIWNGFSFIDQKTWSPKINFFKFFIFWKARHARVTRSRHTWSDQSDHPLLIPILLSRVFHENGQKICIARLTWKYTDR